MKIDAVITWVDGDDPRHKEKRWQYGTQKMLNTDDVAGSTRYKSVGEIFYCVASLNRFAPWLNKIYIVTDEQNPNVEPFLKQYFSEGYIPVEIVDHKIIFRGYEQYLPTFNSICIETMTWRIPGLSEHFIEFNDDLILTAPVVPEDFFTTDGKLVCYGRKYSSFVVKLHGLLKYRCDGSKRVTFKETMDNAAALLGRHLYMIKIYHTPKALLKSYYEQYFSEHPEYLMQNISHRFRNLKQFNAQELQYLDFYKQGKCELRRASSVLLYLKPKKSVEYIKDKLCLFSERNDYKFACFNSLDQVSEEGRSLVVDWIESRIGLK